MLQGTEKQVDLQTLVLISLTDSYCRAVLQILRAMHDQRISGNYAGHDLHL